MAARAAVVVLALPGTGSVEAVMEGSDGVLEALEEGQLVIDTGTARSDAAVHYERVPAERGAEFIDAPSTRGGPGDEPTMFVGGEEAWYRSRCNCFTRRPHDCVRSIVQ